MSKELEYIQQLRGIIARNAMQRLSGGDEIYVTPDDISVGLEIMYAWQDDGLPLEPYIKQVEPEEDPRQMKFEL